MGTSDVMLGLVAGGAALAVLYLVAELVSWRKLRESEVKAGLMLRDLYKKLHASTSKLHERTKPFTKPFTRRPKA
jgi:hypothetical protein